MTERHSIMKLFQKFYPRERVTSVYDIDFQKYYEEGYRGILFDIDNTLVPHGAPADDRVIRFFGHLRAMGFCTCLISNNQKERVRPFAMRVHSHYIENAHKPSRKSYQKALEAMGTDREKTMFVGDQLFTDIYGGNRIGMYSILVAPIHPKEEIQIVLKRYLEKVVLHFYEKDRK